MQQEEAKDQEKHLTALKRWAVLCGLTEDDAEDALQTARINYFRRRGVDYLDDPEAQPRLFSKMMCDAIADCHRIRQRRLNAEQQFAAVQRAPFDEAALHDHLLGKEILVRLPAPWCEVARWRYEEGLSWQAIAQRLNSKVGVVSVQFRRALEEVCRELGLVCRKTAVSRGIKGGDAKAGISEGRQSDAQTEGIVDERGCADDSEPGGTAPHPRRPRRTQRGGVGKMVTTSTGCSQGVPLSPERIKARLQQIETELQHRESFQTRMERVDCSQCQYIGSERLGFCGDTRCDNKRNGLHLYYYIHREKCFYKCGDKLYVACYDVQGQCSCNRPGSKTCRSGPDENLCSSSDCGR